MSKKPTNWNANDTMTARQICQLHGSCGCLLCSRWVHSRTGRWLWQNNQSVQDLRFHTKPKKLPDGMPSIRISSPLIELCNGPQGEFEEGKTTVVSQYGGTASRSAA